MSQSTGFESSNRVYGFDPLPWQKEFIECQEKEVMGSGAVGSGKTRALNEKAALLLAAYPGNRGLLTRKTHTSLAETTVVELRNEVLPDSWIVNHHKQRSLYEIDSPFYPSTYCRKCEWGQQERVEEPDTRECPSCGEYALDLLPTSELYYKGLNTNKAGQDVPSNIMSMNLGFVAIDEAIEITESDYMHLSGRLRLRYLNNPFVPELPIRQIFCTTNPASPEHHLYKRFYEQGIGACFESQTSDNPYNPEDYAGDLETRYTGTTADRYIRGEWKGYEGLVYNEFKDHLHVVDPLTVADEWSDWTVPESAQETHRDLQDDMSSQVGDPSTPGEYEPAHTYPPEDARIIMGIDWGYRPDPTVVQWWAETPSHGYVLYRELFKTRQLPDEMAARSIEAMSRYEVENTYAVYTDTDSGNRADWDSAVRDTIKNEWPEDTPSGSRLTTTSADKEVQSGINTVKRLLKPDENDRAELHFVRGARIHDIDHNLRTEGKPGRTLAEMRGYSYKDDDTEEPMTHDNHGMDAMRYAHHTLRTRGGSKSSSAASVHKS